MRCGRSETAGISGNSNESFLRHFCSSGCCSFAKRPPSPQPRGLPCRRKKTVMLRGTQPRGSLLHLNEAPRPTANGVRSGLALARRHSRPAHCSRARPGGILFDDCRGCGRRNCRRNNLRRSNRALRAQGKSDHDLHLECRPFPAVRTGSREACTNPVTCPRSGAPRSDTTRDEPLTVPPSLAATNS